MSDFSGTKGKWIYNKRYQTIEDEFGYGIAQQNGIHNSRNWEYNAKLIVTAPELLDDSLKDLELFDYLLKSLPLGLSHLNAFIKQRKQEKTELIKKAKTL